MTDAFCPECRNDLDDVPSPKPPAQQGRGNTRSVIGEAFHVWHAVKFGIIAVGIFLVAIVQAIDGNYSLAIALGGSAAVIALAETIRRLVIRAKRAKQNRTIEMADEIREEK
jgi:hypothetical protein